MADQIDTFTRWTIQVLRYAAEEARTLNHAAIGAEHILLALIHKECGVAAQALKEMGIKLPQARQAVAFVSGVGGRAAPGDIELSVHANQVMAYAFNEAKLLNHTAIGTEHVLLSLVRNDEGTLLAVLDLLGVAPERLRLQVLRILHRGQSSAKLDFLGSEGDSAPPSSSGTPYLEALGVSLTNLALFGNLDPVIGRQAEIDRVIKILSRRTKNNPVLIGEPGVGKTAIVEGLAQRIVAGAVPDRLKDRQIVSLDMSALVAGTKYRGQFEKRLKHILDEAKTVGAILFIDEVHTIIGAGGSEGLLDAANILKPALSRGELQTIGATTLDEYRRYIERDAALERRFQSVVVEEPSEEEAVTIMLGVRRNYEEFHQLRISDQAIRAAVRLAMRYVPDRFLPDKAIDLIDEAAAHVRMTRLATSPLLSAALRSLDQIRAERQEALSGGQRALAAGLREREERLVSWIGQIERTTGQHAHAHGPAPACLTEDDIAEVLESWTSIPVTRLRGDEKTRLLQMEQALHERVVGQHEAILAVSKAVRRSLAGLKDPQRPVGSFIFLGPTGVGKTELAKALAAFIFGTEEHLIRVDMSEFQERHTLARLVGAPPGYVGYGEGGQLTDAVRHRPYSVVLFDEIEKAHPDVFNLLLQVLDEGCLADAKGRKVTFRHAIIIMTSNIGTDLIRSASSIGFTSAASEPAAGQPDTRRKVEAALKQLFRPEFLNRIDATMIFHPLTSVEMRQVAAIMLRRLQQRIAEQAIRLEVREDACELLAQRGYDPDLGARPLRRVITSMIEDPLSEGLLENRFCPGDTVIVDTVTRQPGDERTVRLRAVSAAAGADQVPELVPEQAAAAPVAEESAAAPAPCRVAV